MKPSQSTGLVETAIPGLLKIPLTVHRDDRGWFKENYHSQHFNRLLKATPSLAASMKAGFQPVQNNISFNKKVGTTRGIHAEPWNKYITLAAGSAYVAIVDLRPGSNFGRKICLELTVETALFVPKGCGNSYQTLTPNTVYAYLVDDYWTSQAKYTFVNLNDSDLNIPWPIPLARAEISDKDKSHPTLEEVRIERGKNG